MVENISEETAVPVKEHPLEPHPHSNLTRMQTLYWTGYQLRPDAPLYAAPLIFTLKGALDISLFRTALQTVLDQSDALRTIIQVEDGVSRQIVLPQLELPLQIKDFSAEPNPKTAARQWLQQIITVPFNHQKRFVQFALATINPEEHIWLMNQHHIIADASSSFHIFQVVSRTYEQLTNPAAEIELPQITPFHIYRDYLHDYRQSAQYKRAGRYWEQKLVEDVVPLSFFGQRKSKKSTHARRLNIELDAERTARLTKLAEQENVRDLTKELTMFNILAGLFFALVYHLTGNQRIGFLSPVHNRPTQAFRQSIGLLMELCPFVVTFSPGETPASLIQKLKQLTRGVMRFSQHGSSLVLNNKVHDLMFNYHRRPSLVFNGRSVEQEHLFTGHSNDSLALHIHEFEQSGTLKFKFDFHLDIFTEEQQETAVAIFYALFDHFLANFDQPLDQIPLPWSAVHTAVPSNNSAHHPPTTPYVPPRDRLELDLKNLWEENLGISQIGIHDNYFDLGGTSWQAMNLFAEIEKLSGQYLPLATLVEAGSIAALAEKLRQQSGTDAWPTLVPIQTGREDIAPLYLVHGGGGHVLIFTKLTRHLPPNLPVYAFQAKGLDGKTRPFISVEEMAAHYVETLLFHQPSGPYRLGGYSMGGAVAFEMAQQLTARGHKVSFVGIIDTPAQHPALRWVRLVTKLTARILRFSPDREQMLFIKNRHRFWVGFRQIMVNQKNRIAHRINREQQAAAKNSRHEQEDVRVQKITMINNRAYFCYVPTRYPGAVTLFKSTEGYKDIYRDTKDPLMGWQRVSESVDVHTLEGNHNQIMDEPHVQQLAVAFSHLLF